MAAERRDKSGDMDSQEIILDITEEPEYVNKINLETHDDSSTKNFTEVELNNNTSGTILAKSFMLMKKSCEIFGKAFQQDITSPIKKETRKSFLIETSIPFFLTGFGTICAGILFARASKWSFLTEMNEALVLIPPLLGLKGNLEMTLGSRLATWSHMGLMRTGQQQLRMYISCLSLDQGQALIVGFLAAAVASIMYKLEGNSDFTWNHVVALHLAAVVTSSATSFLLCSLMVSIAVFANRCHINPDNISTPFAGMTGDTVTLALFVFFGTFINKGKDEYLVLYCCIIALFMLSSLIWMFNASRNPLTRQVLKSGWFSIITAMFISTFGGYIMQGAINQYPDVPNFQPVLNGVGGNLVAVQSSRISTYLHKNGKYGVLPKNKIWIYFNPLRTYACKEKESKDALYLTLMGIPGNIIFLILIFAINIGFVYWNWIFLIFYLLAAVTQVFLLLYICQFLARIYWLLKINPDNNTIPILTALGDLFGSLLMLAVFVLLKLTGFNGFEAQSSS